MASAEGNIEDGNIEDCNVEDSNVEDGNVEDGNVEVRQSELDSLDIPVKKLMKSQRERLIEEYAENNNHPHYTIKKNKNGGVTIRKRRQTVEQEIAELHPGYSLSPTQLLQAQIINLERKYINLEQKHKKLKRRVNIIDNETVIIDDDYDLTAKPIPEEHVPAEKPIPEDYTLASRQSQRRSLRSLFRQ